MDEGRKTMWYKQNTVLFIQEDEFVLLAGKRIELESIMISELSDHKDKYRHSLTFKIEIEKDVNIEGGMLHIWESEQEDGTWG